MSDVPDAELRRERRLGLVAGLVGLGAVVMLLSAIVVAGIASPSSRVRSIDDAPRTAQEREAAGRRARTREVAPVDPVEQLRNFRRGEAGRRLAQVLRTVGYLLLIPLGLFIYRAAKLRKRDVSGGLAVVAVAAPVAVAVVGVASYLAFESYLDAFFSGPQSAARARELRDGSLFIRATTTLELIAFFAMSVWIGWTVYATMQVGLVTGFVSMLGLAAAFAGIVNLTAGTIILLFWVTAMAVLALGWWPGGRPEAWASGRGEPISLAPKLR